MAGLPTESDTFFRVSPADSAEHSGFAIKRGEADGRLDVNYWWLTPTVNRRLENSRFEVKSLGSLLSFVQYGCSSLAKENQPGVPILRMNNLQDDGWDLSNLKYIELDERELATYRLAPGDILVNRTNSKELVGKCAVFRESGDWVFASYLVRVRTDERRLLPQFASDFLETTIGRLQINRVSRQIIGMTNINAEEIRSICIPLPSIVEQERLVAALDIARAQSKAKLADAEVLLGELDSFLLDTLGIKPPQRDDRRVFAVPLAQPLRAGQLHPDFCHPERLLALRTLSNAAEYLTVAPLSDVVTFVRTQLKTPGDNYLGLAHVESHTGELVDAEDTASGSCFTYENNDVLFARLRPYLNKVYRAEMNGCCSTEFHILRIKGCQELLPDYLATILRSQVVLAQTVHMMTGNTHPRLTNEDVANLKIPIPALTVQEKLVAEVRTRRENARRLRAEAKTGWQEAKEWFEGQLLGSTAV